MTGRTLVVQKLLRTLKSFPDITSDLEEAHVVPSKYQNRHLVVSFSLYMLLEILLVNMIMAKKDSSLCDI